MASSPPYSSAPSPINPRNMSSHVPRKRSISNFPDNTQPSIKRRKPSNLSTSMPVSAAAAAAAGHPLRQSSFPPHHGGTDSIPMYSRSPSVDSAAPSLVGDVTAATNPRKRVRKPTKKSLAKAGTPSNAADGSSNVTNSNDSSKAVGSAKGGGGAGSGAENGPGGGEAEEDEEEANAAADMTVSRATDNEMKEEKMLRAMLVKNFDPEQMMRYEKWRASKIPDSAVKRIVNATVSQSVPANVVLSVRVATKLFLGELIEKAREVQDEWILATGEEQAPIPEPEAPPGVVPREGGRRAPLRPDHISEAYRRYQRDVCGEGVGVMATWHQQTHSGVERFSRRLGGKRLFR